MAQTTSVLWSVDQGLGEDAKAQARKNIGAIGVEKSDGAIPPTISTVNKMTINTSNKSVMCDNQGIGLLIPEPKTGEQNYVLRAGYAGSPGKGWAEWHELEPDSLVILYSGSPQLSETDYQKMVSYVSDKKMVYIMYGMGGASTYYKLSGVSSGGYDFIYESDYGKSVMHIANNRAVTTTTYASQTKIKHEFFFPAGGSDRQTILEVFEVPQLDGKWPTKIVGTFNCTPENGYTCISILPLETYTRQLNSTPYTIETPTSFPDRPSPNWYLYQYELPSGEESKRIKNISGLTANKNNTVNFALEQGNKLLKYIAIKGFATSDTIAPYDKYDITNLNLTYYYD